MCDNYIIKKFNTKDVFYNNGLVNLKIYLEEYPIEGLAWELTKDSLVLKYPKEEDEYYYNKIFKEFIESNRIVYQTENDRLYWYKDNSSFMYLKKYNIVGGSTDNSTKFLYKYITPAELEKTTEELFNEYIDFAKKNNIKESDVKEDTKRFKRGLNFKAENKCQIPLFMIHSEAVERCMEFYANDNILKFDSKIHQFEDGGRCFRDMILNKDNFIDKWDALIYWYGVKIKRYYNSVYYIYLNAVDLNALYELKKRLDIEENPVKFNDEKTGGIKNTTTNVKISSQLKYDGIENNNFYISNSISEFQVKFFMYMTSHIFHVEDEYKDEDNERARKRAEKLYNNLFKISFVTYTEDGNMKSSLDEYTKVYRMITFLKKLMEIEYLDSTLFKYFADLITAINLSKNDQEKVNLNIKKFCENILKFSELRKVYYEVSFKILKNNKRSLGSGLYEFENLYLQETMRGEEIMSLHTKSKELGKEIGVFSANLEDKDLLFKLRNIKNQKQMIGYFKDLKFTILRKQADAKFSNEFNNIMEEIFTEIEDNSSNWELIRDYMAIYAIDKYRSVIYAKQAAKGGK